MRHGRHIPKSQAISVAEAKAQLATLLCGCTDERLAAFTPAYLAGNHRVPLRDCEYALIIERQRRAAAAEPAKCPKCSGDGRVWRYRIDDVRYPVPCDDCGGRGVAAA